MKQSAINSDVCTLIYPYMSNLYLVYFCKGLKLLFSGPHSVVKHVVSHGEFILTWTPSDSEDEENHPICFVVQAELKSDGLNIFALPFLWIYVVLFHF